MPWFKRLTIGVSLGYILLAPAKSGVGISLLPNTATIDTPRACFLLS